MHFAPGRPAMRTRPGIRRSGAQASAGATSSFRSRHRPSATRTFPPRRSSRIASSRRVVARAASLLLLLLLLRSFFPVNHGSIRYSHATISPYPTTLPRLDFEFSRRSSPLLLLLLLHDPCFRLASPPPPPFSFDRSVSSDHAGSRKDKEPCARRLDEPGLVLAGTAANGGVAVSRS